MTLSENKRYLLNTGDVVSLIKTCPNLYYSWSVFGVNGKVDDFFGERFTEEGKAYHDDCYKIIREV